MNIYTCTISNLCTNTWHIFICLIYEYAHANDSSTPIIIMEDKRIVSYTNCLKYDIDW